MAKLVQQAGVFIGNMTKLDKIVPRSNGNANFFAINCSNTWLVEQIHAVLTSVVQLQPSMFETILQKSNCLVRGRERLPCRGILLERNLGRMK